MDPITGIAAAVVLGLGLAFTNPEALEQPSQHRQTQWKEAAEGPTKDVMRPGQGLDVAQERCPKYAGDEVAEVACVLFHAGVVKKDKSGKYQLNAELIKPIEPDTRRPVGKVWKCPGEFIHLPDGSIGFTENRESPKCGYR